MTKWLKYSAIPALFVLAWAGPAAFAARATTPSKNAKSTAKTAMTPMSDSAFAKAAAEGGFAEVKFGQLAEDKGSSQQVKDFGKRMVTDHTKAEDNLKTVLSKDKLSVSIPTQLNAKDQATYQRLSKLSGSAFDRAYATDMVKDHVGDISAFRHEASNGKDSSIKSFAAQTLPTLQDHLKDAREMEHSVSAETRNTMKKQKS
jgi:putative membrane protein